MAASRSETEGKRLPKGFFKPGYITTAGNPDMRRRAERMLKKLREEAE